MKFILMFWLVLGAIVLVGTALGIAPGVDMVDFIFLVLALPVFVGVGYLIVEDGGPYMWFCAILIIAFIVTSFF